ncbi:type I restriction endonuclease, partial [Thiolapillus sp.]
MDLIDGIKELATRIPKQMDHIQTEEATKNAFIMPFLSVLGYDVFNPMEVIPEYTADIGTKKGEKVDYVIKKDDEIIILIECKWSGIDLHQNHASQLY